MKHVFTHLALLCLFLSATIRTNAQQDPHFTQYMHNKLFMNPAYAGMKHALCFTGIMRDQWSGFDGAPKSGVFAADLFLEDYGGFGATIMYDQLGFERNMSYRLAYSYHLEEIFGGTLGIGIDAGGASKTLGPTGSQSWVATTNWTMDPTVPPQMKTSKLDIGAGVWYERDNMWFGISSSHLNGGAFNDGIAVVGNQPHPMLYQVAHHYWITAGYKFNTRAWMIQPSFLVKSDATVTSCDLSVTATYNDLFWIGANYRVKDAICPMIGFNWITENKTDQKGRRSIVAKRKTQEQRYNVMRIGFAYDYTTSKLNQYNNGTFELFLSYCLPWTPATSRHGDVRIFDKPE